MTQEVYEKMMIKLDSLSEEINEALEALRPDPIVTIEERLNMLDEMI
jgi:hypothetical protein